MQSIYGRKLAVVTRRKNPVGADLVQLHTGILAFTQCELLLDRGIRKRPFRLRSEWMSRVESVGRDDKDRLDDAELLLSLTVGGPSGSADMTEQEFAVLA